MEEERRSIRTIIILSCKECINVDEELIDYSHCGSVGLLI